MMLTKTPTLRAVDAALLCRFGAIVGEEFGVSAAGGRAGSSGGAVRG